ncbi:protein sok, partial [Escherichia coli]|nr:protein sok [Escherichia coli]
MKINLLRGYLLSATQHGNKPPSRHEAESLKRRAHHSP